MRGDHYLLALTTTTDDVTGEVKPLFAFPVQIAKGWDDKGVKFEVAAPSGAKRVQKFMDPATGELVEDADCPRGVFVGDEFRPIDKDAIDTINSEEKITTMVALGYVPLSLARERYADRVVGRYLLQVPKQSGSAKAYRIVYEALRGTAGPKKKLAPLGLVVKRTKRTKQALGLIYADEEQALVMLELLFAGQVREADDAVRMHTAVEVEQAMVNKARELVLAMDSGEGVLAEEHDTNEERKTELIEAALAGESIEVPTPISTTVEVDDLEAQLEASLAVMS